MPSESYLGWTTTRKTELDQIADAHVAVGGIERGRRYATQQINHAYAVLLASQFQGYCRDLHTECVDHLLTAAIATQLKPILRIALTGARALDRGNAQPEAIGKDFHRLGVRIWDEAIALNATNSKRRILLENLNQWRNAIAHQDFSSTKLGSSALQIVVVRKWRVARDRLALAFEKVMYDHLSALTGTSPW